jgi:hypothetical protein
MNPDYKRKVTEAEFLNRIFELQEEGFDIEIRRDIKFYTLHIGEAISIYEIDNKYDSQ